MYSWRVGDAASCPCVLSCVNRLSDPIDDGLWVDLELKGFRDDLLVFFSGGGRC
jgi:hypothetical protein